ncbi:uncharacterized protein LODBEIA_P09840 [Lodderomyces beijingensis]|uniref:Conserved oligomeric Golgi complex subunit 2 n=1 Tax=Lodderomyces beijingensis TaxID=1775926 RepID=A0ABP0ZF19_9ASCO
MDHNDYETPEEFPFPVSIVATNFKGEFKQEHIDHFLYKNHRFTSLDILIKDLKKLSSQLNQNLLDLVNHDYNDFIKLGKSINGGSDLISSISEDLKNFKNELTRLSDKFSTMDDMVREALETRQALIDVKTNLKLSLLMHDQIQLFDACVKEDKMSAEQLRKVTGVYLSIMNIEEYLQRSGEFKVEGRTHFEEQYVQSKISSIFLEFKSYLQETADKNRTERDGDLALEIAKINTVLGLK